MYALNLLLSNAIGDKKNTAILFSRVTLVMFFYSAFLGYNTLYFLSLEKGVFILSGLFYITSLNITFSIFLLIITSIILVLTSYYPRKIWNKSVNELSLKGFLFSNSKLTALNVKDVYKVINKENPQYKVSEYGLIILFVNIGAIFLLTANDLVSIFLAIELQSYGLYLICCLWRDSIKAVSAGLTYFLLGALSSCLILLGTAILYVFSGTTNLDIIYTFINLYSLCDYIFVSEEMSFKYESLNIAFTLISAGFLFKISAAPFHFWSPDVYDQIPTVVTTFVANIAKISILIFLLKLLQYENSVYWLNNTSWTYCLLISCFLSFIFGTVLGLKETKIKRLFALSTISHIGFMLLAISINSLQSIQAFIFYLMQYSLSNINVFFYIIMIGYSLYYYTPNTKDNSFKYSDKNNSPLQLLSELKGYFIINPVISLGLAITIFSFIGVPPLVGFFGKQMVLLSAINKGYVFLSLTAIITSVIGAVYYLSIVKYIFFSQLDKKSIISFTDFLISIIERIKNDKKIKNKNSAQPYVLLLGDLFHSKSLLKLEHVTLSSSLTLITSALTLIILLFILSPEESLNLSNIISLMVFIH